MPDRLGHSFGLHRAMDTLGAVIGIAIAYVLFTTTRGEYTKIFLLSTIPGILGVAILFWVREKNSVKVGARVHPLAAWKTLHPNLKAFLLVAFLFTLGNSSNQFLLLRATSLGFKPADAILAYLLFNIVYALSCYPAGRFSDHAGRRSMLAVGYVFYGLVYLGFAFASTAMHVWVLFGIYGLYTGLTEGVEKALVAELCPGESRATLLGLHATLVGIGLLPASLIGGFLWRLVGPEAPFYFGGVMGVLAALGMYFVVPKLDPTACPSQSMLS